MNLTAKYFTALEEPIERAAAAREPQGVASGWRAILDEFYRVSAARIDPERDELEPDYMHIWDLAAQALANLGGQADLPLDTLADYDAEQFGPMLGVSDEGSATAAIRHGALRSPKCAALTTHTPLSVGVAHDAERLGAIGEVAVGPDEYARILLNCRGRLLTTTNVGTSVNVRHFRDQPEIIIRPGPVEKSVGIAIEQLKIEFAPYVRTASGKARTMLVFVRFDAKVTAKQRGKILNRLQTAVASGSICDRKRHYLGLVVVAGHGKNSLPSILAAMDIAASSGIAAIALDTPLHKIDSDELARVLQHADKLKLRVTSRHRVDPQTTARHVWTGLAVARNMGMELGKYGLVPLTLEEQREVIARIQFWFRYWCAAPVFYVDHPLITKDDVFHGARLVLGIRRWLEMVDSLGVRVVLIDTARKSEGRRLLRESAADERGFLTADEIDRLTAFASTRKIKVLWAGGITLPQAYLFGKMGVFGVYVTTAAAELKPLGKKERRDPFLTGRREPSEDGVALVKLLLEAGFLEGRGNTVIKQKAEALVRAIAAQDEGAIRRLEKELHPIVVQAWKEHFAANS